MPSTCSTCNQEILTGEDTDDFRGETFHVNPNNCVSAVVRRCIALVEERESRIVPLQYTAVSVAKLIRKDIRKEFGLPLYGPTEKPHA